MLPANLLHKYKYNKVYHWIAPNDKKQYWNKEDIDNNRFRVETNHHQPLI